MKTFCTLALALVIGAVATADDKKADFDTSKLVGDWSYTSGQKAGEKVAEERLKESKVSFTKDTVTVPGAPGMKFVMTFKIDGSKTPAQIDLEVKEGEGVGSKAKGIIALDGDTLKLAYTHEGDRPAKFESTKDNKAHYFTLKKAK